jgi:O-Antigen ligase
MAGRSSVSGIPLASDAPDQALPGPSDRSGSPVRGGFPTVLALVYVAGLCGGIGAIAGPVAGTVSFAASSALAAAWLAVRHPTDYVLFAIAVWITAPEVRRIADWSTGTFDPTSFAAVAPYAVVVAGLLGVIGRPRPRDRRLLGVVLAYIALAGGFAVGLLSYGPLGAGFAFLEWVSPFLLVHYVLTRGLAADLLRRGIWVATLWIGLYGTFQYFVLPGWDKFWLAHAPIDSAGRPVAAQFRVFSTLNSPGTMAIVLAVLVLLLLATFRTRDLVALVPAFAALALSLVRASWLVIAVGVLLLLVVRGRDRKTSHRGILAVLVTALLVVAVAPTETLGSVGERIGTATQLGRDQSFNSRIAFFQDTAAAALLTPVGNGLGSTGVSSRLQSTGSSELTKSFDNGILNIPYTLGWPGTALFVAGLVLLCRSGPSRRGSDRGPPYGRLLVAGGTALVFVNVLTGASGYFLGLVLALHLLGADTERRSAPTVAPR